MRSNLICRPGAEGLIRRDESLSFLRSSRRNLSSHSADDEMWGDASAVKKGILTLEASKTERPDPKKVSSFWGHENHGVRIDMTLPTLMILDGETRSALSVVRSLGRKGIPMIVGSHHGLGRSGFSKYPIRRFTYPDIKKDPDTAHSVILQQIESLHPYLLMPIYDPGWELTYAHYDEYADRIRIVPNPGRHLFQNLLDKGFLAECAERSGIPTPRPIALKRKRLLWPFVSSCLTRCW